MRYHVLQILANLVRSEKVSALQQVILASPLGISRLMDCLSDSREVVRNDCLLLMIELMNSNQEIQKIVAFEGVFECIFQIISDEGGSNGGIVVIDCLRLMQILLHNNTSNQNYFRETGCIQRLCPLLELESSDMWILTDNKVLVLTLTLQVISELVGGDNSDSQLNQSVLSKHNILASVMKLALERINSTKVRAQALRTAGDLIRNHQENRNIFSATTISNISESGPLSSLQRLVVILLHSPDFYERAAAQYAFECFFVDNEEGQLAVASTLTPSPDVSDGEDLNKPQSVGYHLANILKSWKTSDSLQIWYAACMLSAILKDSPDCKHLVLRIPLELPKPGVPMVTLLETCFESLKAATSQAADKVVRVALLRLFCIWMDECPKAVKTLLQYPTNLPFLVEQVGQPVGDVHIQGLCALLIGFCLVFSEEGDASPFNRESVRSIIMHRIGVDKYTTKLDRIRKSKEFILAEHDTPIVPVDSDEPSHSPEDLFYNYDFTLFFKDAHDKILVELKSPFGKVRPSPSPGKPRGRSRRLQSQEGADSLKIAELEEKIRDLEDTLTEVAYARSQAEKELEDKSNQLTALLEAQDKEQAHSSALSALNSENEAMANELNSVNEKYNIVMKENAELKVQNKSLEGRVHELEDAVQSLSSAYNDFENVLAAKDAEITSLRNDSGNQDAVDTAHQIAQYTQQIEELKSKNQSLSESNLSLSRQLQEQKGEMLELEKLREENALATQKVKELQAARKLPTAQQDQASEQTIKNLKEQLEDLQLKYKSMEEEQEELLVCLATEEIKSNALQERLKHFEAEKFGTPPSSSETA